MSPVLRWANLQQIEDSGQQRASRTTAMAGATSGHGALPGVLLVLTSSGTVLTQKVKPSDSVVELKAQLRRALGMLPAARCMLLHGRGVQLTEMLDKKLLSDYSECAECGASLTCGYRTAGPESGQLSARAVTAAAWAHRGGSTRWCCHASLCDW